MTYNVYSYNITYNIYSYHITYNVYSYNITYNIYFYNITYNVYSYNITYVNCYVTRRYIGKALPGQARKFPAGSGSQTSRHSAH